MSKSNNYLIHDKPNWLLEAAVCIAEQYFYREGEVIENHNKFGMNKDEMIDSFRKYKDYKKSISSEIMPIYAGYPLLDKIFREIGGETEIGICFATSLVMFCGDRLSLDMDNKIIDEIINEFMVDTISDLRMDYTQDEVIIHDLTGLIDLLDIMNIDDVFKMQLIHVYRNKHEIMKQLSEMLHACAFICKKYFYIIEEECDKLAVAISEIDDLEAFLDSSVGMKINTSFKGEIFPTIMCFNQFSMRFKNNKLVYHMGIYFLNLVDLKEKNKFNDAQIITDLKALADPSRLKIIDLISKDKMYLQELAEALSLTPATISHHINVLLKSELISITIDAERTKKTYYETNCTKIESLGDSIKKLVTIQDQGGDVYGGKSKLSIW